jgi:hypothetical protein
MHRRVFQQVAQRRQRRVVVQLPVQPPAQHLFQPLAELQDRPVYLRLAQLTPQPVVLPLVLPLSQRLGPQQILASLMKMTGNLFIMAGNRYGKKARTRLLCSVKLEAL